MGKTTIVDIVTAEVLSVGLQVEVERGGKHPKIRFYASGQRYTYVVPATASDHRTALNCRAGIRRLIRQALGESDLPSATVDSKQRARKGAHR
jgi:hypothetical protein